LPLLHNGNYLYTHLLSVNKEAKSRLGEQSGAHVTGHTAKAGHNTSHFQVLA